MMLKKTIPDFQDMKIKCEKVAWVVCYEEPRAHYAELAGVDMILIGDSAAMNVYGHGNTDPITMDQMIALSQAVRRGAPNTFIIGDMPLGSYQISPAEAVFNALRFYKEANIDAVKLEGGRKVMKEIAAIVNAGKSVIGHIGLTPQSAGQLGGFKAQGKTAKEAIEIIKDAIAVEAAGAFAILVEAVPADVAKIISQKLKIPVLSIGAGPYCDGQLLLAVDLLGESRYFIDPDKKPPKFVKNFVSQALGTMISRGEFSNLSDINFANITVQAFKEYIKEVKAGFFPDLEEHCYKMLDGELEKLKTLTS